MHIPYRKYWFNGCRMMPIHVSVFCCYSCVSGASVTCMPTAVCLTRGSWAVSVNTTPQGQTAAAVRSTTMEEPGVWGPTSLYPKELQIYVSTEALVMLCGQALAMQLICKWLAAHCFHSCCLLPIKGATMTHLFSFSLRAYSASLWFQLFATALHFCQMLFVA